jgi:hypothetical protein
VQEHLQVPAVIEIKRSTADMDAAAAAAAVPPPDVEASVALPFAGNIVSIECHCRHNS